MHPASKKYTTIGRKFYQLHAVWTCSNPVNVSTAYGCHFREIKKRVCDCYLKNVIMRPCTVNSGTSRTSYIIFQILENENLRLNREKCQFGTMETDYFGLIISGGKRWAFVNKEKFKILHPTNQK